MLGFSEWAEAEAEIRRSREAGVRIVPFIDPCYPARLRAIADPPPLLYVKGDLSAADEKAVAIVGSRSASDYGRKVARNICRGLASLGFTVVSGMARGIDGMAHETALDGGGRTIAVLGSGVDRIYPPEHEGLSERIARQGAVISELPLGARPVAFNFPARNRLISGLSLGVVVVEATEKSGSLITAALPWNRTGNFCRAGRGGLEPEPRRAPFDPPGRQIGRKRQRYYRRNRAAISAPVRARAGGNAALPQNCSDDTRKIFGLLQERILQIDEVIEPSGSSSAQVSQILLELELQGFLRQLPGNVTQPKMNA